MTPDDYDDLAYDRDDYKRSGWLDELLDAADEGDDR